MKKYIVRIIIFTFCLKISYFIFGLAVSKFDAAAKIEFDTVGFLSLFERSDAGWYKKAAEEGYPKITNALDLGYSYQKYYKQSVWAHFPFYPLTIRYTEKIFNLDFIKSAFVLSCIFSLASFIGFYFLCINIFGSNERDSFIYTLVFMVFPFHYYFNVYYTEALYFSFLSFAFIAIKKKIYWLTSVLVIPLTLVRPNGITAVIPLFVFFMENEGGG